MEGFKIIAFIVLWGFQLHSVLCQDCDMKADMDAKIFVSDFSFVGDRCWTIPLPSSHYMLLQFEHMDSDNPCDLDYVKITIAGTKDEYKFCAEVASSHNTIVAFDDVTVYQHVSSTDESYTDFSLKYTIKSIKCLEKNSFKCDSNFCVNQDQVCDGVEDCLNGNDEAECEKGIQSIEGVSAARENAVSWLKRERSTAWGWKDTPRAVIALYLSSEASFNGTVLEEELMAKQTELKTAVALLRPSLTNSELSMFVNALLVTCRNPRQFYGNNLVERLKAQVEESGNLTHPLAYLALCNANEPWPLQAVSDIESILISNSEYPFVKDLQAMALTALSCEANRSSHIGNVLSNTTLALYKEMVQGFKNLLSQDGTFGNAHTTALITQALLSSGQEHSKDWSLNATLKYLMKELNSSSVDFLTTYLALPILNGKSLMDISRVNCSTNPLNHGDDLVSEINDYLGTKVRVQYYLYIGDEIDVVHTISLRVPENYTAFEVMELAEVEDPKYKFEWKMMSGKMYLYKIAGVANDPEDGKYWLLYAGAANSSETLTHFTSGPDEIFMSDGESLVLWYKTTTI